jgi:NitT/TauT family transport system substrate-binding protein
MSLRTAIHLLLASALLLPSSLAKAQTEASEVRIAKQYGIGYLPLMIMEHDKLLEKHIKAAGLPDATVTWATFTGSAAMNDALLSGGLDFAAVGPPGIALLWSKTKGTPQEVKGITSLTSMALFLNSRDPDVKSVKDLSAKNKIALPAAKVSTMAIVLQMAVEKEFGPGSYDKLDYLTITRAHPDAMVALLSGKGEIDTHFTWPPFQYRELKAPGIRTILNSLDVTGGPATTVGMAMPARFRTANPKTTKAFIAALEEANDIIRKQPKYAAEVYINVAKDRDTVENIVAMLEPEQFTITPTKMMLFAEFMHKVGTIKSKPESWKDMFYPEVHHLPGS